MRQGVRLHKQHASTALQTHNETRHVYDLLISLSQSMYCRRATRTAHTHTHTPNVIDRRSMRLTCVWWQWNIAAVSYAAEQLLYRLSHKTYCITAAALSFSQRSRRTLARAHSSVNRQHAEACVQALWVVCKSLFIVPTRAVQQELHQRQCDPKPRLAYVNLFRA